MIPCSGLLPAARVLCASAAIVRAFWFIAFAFAMALALATRPAAATPNVGAVKDDGVAATAKKAPGSTITYTVTITNTGSSDAQNVQLTDAIPTNTTLVAGSVVAAPIAVNDAYAAIGNTRLYVGLSVPTGQAATTASTTVLANDLSPATGGLLAVTALNESATTQGGTVTLNTNGTFVYTPPANYAGTDTFTYTLTGSADATLTSTGTVSITVSSSRVWYVDNSYAGANGTADGRSHRPFTTLSVTSSASSNGDTIFVHTGSGSYTGGITLKASQSLVGEGAALVVNSTTLLAAGSAPTIVNSNTGGTGVALNTGNTLNGFNVGNCSGAAVIGRSFGTLVVSNVAINTDGQALDLETGTVSSSGTGFTSITSTGGNKNISLVNLGGTIALGTGSLSGAPANGSAFYVHSGSPTIVYNGSITKTTLGVMISINNLTGGSVSLNGNLAANTSAGGVSVALCSGSVIEFNGASKVLNTGSQTAVGLTNNTNTLITFANGGLDIDTGSGLGFYAVTNTGTSAIRVTGTGNSITTTTGTALSVATTIHASGLTFQSISAGTPSSGPANGILLDNTGTGGGLTVTGTGTSGSGGTIQKTTGAGIKVTKGANLSLSNMTIQNCGTVANSSVSTGNPASGILLSAVTGTCSITGTTVTGSYDSNVHVANTSGTLALTLTNSNFNSSTNGPGFRAETIGTASVTITGTGCQFNGNSRSVTGIGFIGGIVNSNSSLSSGAAASFSSISLSNCQFNSNFGGAHIYGNGSADSKFTFTNNTFSGNGTLETLLFLAESASSNAAKLRGVASGNTITHATAAGIAGINWGLGAMMIEVLLNNITSSSGASQSIYIGSSGGPTTRATAAKLASNTISAASATPLSAIQVQAGSGSEARTVALNISTNTVNLSGAAVGLIRKLRVTKTSPATFNIQGLSPSPATAAQVPAALAALTGIAAADITASGSGNFTAATVDTSAATAAPLLLDAAPETVAVGVARPSFRATRPSRLVTSSATAEAMPVVGSVAASETPAALTQSTLATLVAAARARWESTGLTAAQRAQLAALRFEIADLPNWHLGEASGSRIRVDRDAGGRGWFVATDAATPVPADRVDLFTAVLHEMGHALGLADSYLAHERASVMFGWLRTGERRLPAIDQARDAHPHAAGVTHFLSAPISIGTLPAGKSVTLKFTVQVADPIPSGVTQIVSQGTVSGSNFSDILTDDPEATGSNNPTVTLLDPPASNNASLANLVFSGGGISPSFTSAQETYSASQLPRTTTSVTVTPTADHVGATIAVRINSTNAADYVAVASGSASAALPLQVGENKIHVRVTAADGTTTRTYTLTVRRAAAADLAVSITASPAGAVTTSTVSYTVTVTNHGPDPVVSIVKATLATNLTFASVTPPADWLAPSKPAVGSAGDIWLGHTDPSQTIASGASRSMTIVANVASAVPGARLAFQAEALSFTEDPAPVNNVATLHTLVGPAINPARATPLAGVASGVRVSGNLQPATTVDVYSFTARAGDRVYAATATSPGSAEPSASRDTILRIVAADGATVLEFDDDDGFFSSTSSSISGRVLPADGTYYVLVDCFRTDAQVCPYELYVQVQSGTPTAENTAQTAAAPGQPLGGSRWVAGRLDAENAPDLYKVTLNAGDTLFASLDLDPARSGALWDGLLTFSRAVASAPTFSANGSDLESKSLPNSEALFVTVRESGDYWLTVASMEKFGDYHLSATVIPAATENTSTTYVSADTNVSLLGDQGVISSLSIPDDKRIGKLKVALSLEHAYIPGLEVYLTAPDGNTVGLFRRIGDSSITTLDLTLDDAASIALGLDSLSSLTGTIFKPGREFRLGWFQGQQAKGTWKLTLYDRYGSGSAGTLKSWSLTVVDPDPLPAGAETVRFKTDFETNDAGFTHSGTSDGWEYGTPNATPITTAASGTKMWKTRLAGSYDFGSNQDLFSPNIDLTGVPASNPIVLSWAMKYQLGDASTTGAFVEVQEVGGASTKRVVWRWLDASMRNTDVGASSLTIDEAAGWGVHRFRISEFAGKTIRLRFHLENSSSEQLAGLAIDDVAVTSYGASVSSLARVDATPSKAGTVNWTLTFGTAVTGVTASNFSLGGTAASGATIGTPTTTNSGLTWNIPVVTGSTDGTLTLSLANATGLSVGLSTALPFAGELFTMDKTAPRLASIARQTPTNSPTNADTLTWRLTFNEAVQNVNAADFAVSGTTATVTSVTAVAASNDTAYDITISGGDLANLNATLTLGFASGQNIADLAANALTNTTPTGSTNDNTFTVANNAAPVFVGSTIVLAVAKNSAATSIKDLLHVSDADSGQTLTWSQTAAPSHGTLAVTNATANSGGADIASGGTLTYQPAADYVGSDSFTLQISDGIATATRTVKVLVNAPNIAPIALYASTFPFDGDLASRLYRLDPTLGTPTYVGAIGFPAVMGLSFHPTTRTLYGFAHPPGAAPQLITINPATGAGTAITTISGLGTGAAISDSAFHPDGTLIVTVFIGGIYRIDLATGAATEVNAQVLENPFGDGIAFASSSVLRRVGVDTNSFVLETRNATTAVVESSTALTFPSPFADPARTGVALLDVDPVGTWWTTAFEADPFGPRFLATVNPTTGVVTAIGPTGLVLQSLAVLRTNTAPTLALDAGTLAYTENDPLTAIAPNATVSDVDGNWSGGRISAALSANITTQSIELTSATGLTLGGSSGNITISDAGTTFASGNATSVTGNSTLTFNLNASASTARVQQVVRALSFRDTSDNPTNSASVAISVVDGANATASANRTITLASANDAPVLGNVSASATYTPGGSNIVLSAGTTLTDADASFSGAATITITAGGYSGDVLSATATGNFSASYNATNRTLTISSLAGATSAMADVLRSVTYHSTNTDPTNAGANPTRTITWQVADGMQSSVLSNAPTTTIAIADVIAPRVMSIARLSPTPAGTAATTLVFRVTFSEAVQNVDKDDFTLFTTGSATGTIASVSAVSGTTFDVTVTNVSGIGAVRVDLKTAATIGDAGNNPIGTGGFTGGQTYGRAEVVSAFAWGYNQFSNLGNGSTRDRSVPIFVNAVAGQSDLAGKFLTALALGNTHSLALCSDGTVLAWGVNQQGQLGNGTMSYDLGYYPAMVGGPLTGKTIVAIAAGTGHQLAVTADGAVYTWGWNNGGQLGDGTTIDRATPVLVNFGSLLAPGEKITAIAAGELFSIALSSTGKVYTWGSNSNGQLGNSSSTDSFLPVAVATTGGSALVGKTVAAIAAGRAHALVLSTDGQVYSWGANVGIVPSAVAATGDSALAGKIVTAIAAGSLHNVALLADGTVCTWGYNYRGQLGNPAVAVDTTVPVAVNTGTGSALAGKIVTAISAGNDHTFALTADGQVVAWGGGSFGKLGNGSTADAPLPVLVDTGATSALRGATPVALAVGPTADSSAVLGVTPHPHVETIAFPADGSYKAGATLTFALTFDRPVSVEGAPRLPVSADPVTYADYVSTSSDGKTLAFVYTAPTGSSTFGITIGATLDLNGAKLNASGSSIPALLLLDGPDFNSVVIDNTRPTLAAITRGRDAAAYTNATSVTFTAVFNEDVAGVDISDFVLTTTGTATGTISAVTASGGIRRARKGGGSGMDVTVTGVSGLGTLRLDLKSSETGIVDRAGNSLATGGFTTGETFTLAASVASTYDGSNAGDPLMVEIRNLAPTQGTRRAAKFTTGESPYRIDALVAPIAHFDGEPTLRVRIVNETNSAPGDTVIATFTLPQFLEGGNHVFALTGDSAVTLEARTAYWLVLDHSTSELSSYAWFGGTATTASAHAEIAGTPSAWIVANTPGAFQLFGTLANSAPSLALDTAALAYTENAAAAPISPTGTASDAQANWNNGTLTVRLSAGSESTDLLALATPADLTRDGTAVKSGATTVATLSAASVTGSSTLTITFNAATTNAHVQAILRALTFANTSENPSTAARTVTLTLIDSFGVSASATRAINVTAVNDAPTLATVNTLTGGIEDTVFTISFAALAAAADEADVDSSTLSFLVAGVSSGTLTKNGSAAVAGTTTFAASESLVWTPAAHANGTTAAFTVKASDGETLSATAVAVNVALTEVNDSPIAANDTLAAIAEDSGPRTIPFATLLDNDSTGPANESAQTLTITSVTGATISGTNVIYTPAANYHGAASFTYTISDNGTTNGSADAKTSTATASFTITSVNDAPAGTDKTILANEDTGHTFAAADFGFSDANDSPANTLFAVKIATLPAAGTLTLNNGTVAAGDFIPAAAITNLKFTPGAHASGTPYASFTFQVQDTGGTANGGADLDPTANTITLNVTSLNDAPAGTDKAIALNEDASHTFTAADFGFTDPNDTPAHTLLAVKIATLPTAGTLTLNNEPFTAGISIPVASLANLKFTPAANAFGMPYASFTFQVQDSGGTENAGIDLDPTANTITFNVAPQPDAPVATDATTAEDAQSTSGLVLSRHAADGDEVTHFKITAISGGTLFKSDGTTALANDALITFAEGNAGLKFTPDANANTPAGGAFSFAVQAAIETALSSATAVTITVTEVNDMPTAANDSLDSIAEDSGPLTIPFATLLANDSTGPANESEQTLTIVSATGATISGTNVIYTPAANYHGPASFTYTISDNGTTNGSADAKTSTATASFTITSVNDAPTDIALSNTSVKQSSGTSAVVGTLSSTDVDDTTFTYALVGGEGAIDNVAFEIAGATLRAKNAADLAGRSYSIRIQTDDGRGGTFAKIFSIAAVDDVAPVAPSTPDLAAASDSGSSDTDNITKLTTLIFTGTAETGATVKLFAGTAQVGSATASDGTWTITTSPLAEGTHAITATTTDASNNSGMPSAALTITIDTTTPAAPAFTAISDDTGAPGDKITSDTTLILSGTAEAGTTVSVARLGAGALGNASSNGAGAWSFDYTGTALAAGEHSFSATATDVAGNTSAPSAPLIITIDTATPQAPVIASISTDSGQPADGVTNDPTLTLAGTAEPGATVAISRSSVGELGTVTADAKGDWTYDYTGTSLADGMYLFSATARDSAGNLSAASDFPVVVDTVAPVITAGTAHGTYGSAFSYNISATGAATSYGASGLPAGLTLAADTGAISGTPTETGTFTVSLTATDAAGNTGTGTLSLAIAQVNLSVAGVTATSRIYDRTTAAALVFTSANLVGVIAGDAGGVTLVTTAATGAFATKAVGAAKPVTVSGLAITGPKAVHYTLAQPTVTADVTPKELTVTGVSAANKVYDGTAQATLAVSGATLVGVLSGDVVALDTSSAAGVFGDADAGSGKAVMASGFVLGGADAANYTLTLPALSAAISPAPIAFAFGGLNHVYDGSAKSATATTSPSFPVVLSYSATPLNAGTYTVSASASSANYAGSATATLTIAKATQTVTFSVGGAAKIGTPIAFTASASSGLPVTVAVTSGNATVSGTSVTLNDVNPVTLRATQAGNENYNPASAEQTLTATGKLEQAITFVSPGDKRASDPAFTLSASASSGLPVTFSVSGPASLSGSTLSLTGSGQVTVRASQPGNATYAPAADVTHAFNVAAGANQIFFGTTTGNNPVGVNLGVDGRTGTMITFIDPPGEAFVVSFTLNPDGTFETTVSPLNGNNAINGTVAGSAPPRAAAELLRTFRGQLVNGVLTGSIVELGVTFTANVQPSSGPTAGIAGFYQAASTNTAAGSAYSVVGTQGQVLVVAVTPNVTAAGTAMIAAGNSFAVQTSSTTTISGTIDAVTTTVSGSIAVAGRPSEGFSGTSAPRTDRLIDLASRARLTADGSGTLITGFVIGGSTPKRVLLRAVGPALAGFGVQDALLDPKLRLFDSAGALLTENDNWSGDDTAAVFGQVGAFALSIGSRDAALVTTLAPGAYSMHVLNGGGSGVVLAEIYDASANPGGEVQRLVNLSSRGMVSAGEGGLIGGFVITGNSPKKVLIRGIGPALTPFGVTGALADPQLTVFDAQGEPVARNDNWSTPVVVMDGQIAATAAEIVTANAAAGAFALSAGSKDAVLIITLAPGAYTAQVSGVTNTTGAALVEIYEIP